jgi:methanogenic corrinoid protein MtbC1
MSQESEPETGLTIGVVSRETGVPVETLRTWERRYGVPTPLRTPSGHRIYETSAIEHVRLIVEALQRGDRASRVLPLTRAELNARLELLRKNPVIQTPQPTSNVVQMGTGVVTPPDIAEQWVDHARRLDGDEMDMAFRSDWSGLGALRFLAERAAPFLAALGESWVQGRIDVYHEHFATERLRDFLASTWRPLSDASRGPGVVLATLPGERHALGLHMAASVVALAGCRVTFLGSDTPVADIEGATRQMDAYAVVLSVSQAADPARVRDALRVIRSRLDRSVDIVVGGAGAPPEVDGVHTFSTLYELSDWAQQLRNQQRSSG